MAYDNAMVAHVWAQQEKETGRSGNGNFSFSGATLYSYSTPIARFVTAPDGRRVTLVTSRHYSQTTSGKHMPAMWRAIDYGAGSFAPCFRVPDLSGDHAANLAYLSAEYADALAKYRRALSSIDFRAREAEKAHNAARDYAETFALDVPANTWAADDASVRAYHAERAARNNTPAKQAARDKAAQRRAERAEREAALERAEKSERLEAWRSGEISHLRYDDIRTDEHGGALLRIRGDTLETSQGASVPLDHAKRVFATVKRCRDAGTSWRRNGETIRVGHFQVDEIAPDGNFRAGCHLINWPETERAARAAGVL